MGNAAGLSDAPVTIPSIGLAFNVIPRVAAVAEGSPAAEAGIEPGDKILEAELVPSEEAVEATPDAKAVTYEIGDETTWAFVFWMLQEEPSVSLTLTYRDAETDDVTEAAIPSVTAVDWWLPTSRGLVFDTAMYPQTAKDIGDAFSLAFFRNR